VINQHMKNSPNAIQAGGDVIINKAPPGRTISNEARAAFLDALTGTTGCVIVQSFTGNTEAADFNHEIADAFRAASWVVTDFGPSFTFSVTHAASSSKRQNRWQRPARSRLLRRSRNWVVL
jgi:hypothetical protein